MRGQKVIYSICIIWYCLTWKWQRLVQTSRNKQGPIGLWSPEQSWRRPAWFCQGSHSSSWIASASLDCPTPTGVFFRKLQFALSPYRVLLLQALWISGKIHWPSSDHLPLLSKPLWPRLSKGNKRRQDEPPWSIWHVSHSREKFFYPKGARGESR